MAKKIILHVVTGFLGAGKTTFIQAMMAELARRNEQQILPEKLVYVVNEFGQKGVDAAILEDSAVTSYELANGCICCSLKAEFSLAMMQIVHKHQPDRIIFEPSGLFILSELLQALSGESFSEHLCVGSIVTLIDARHHRTNLNAPIAPVLTNQAVLSDLLVVSKLPPDPAAALDHLIDLHVCFPNQSLLTKNAWEFTTTDWQLVLDQKPRSLHQFRLQTSQRIISNNLLGVKQHQKLDSLSIELAETSSLTKETIDLAMQQLANGSYGKVLRAKGFVHCEGKTWLIQMVNDQIDWHPALPGKPHLFVLIGLELQSTKIRQLFETK